MEICPELGMRYSMERPIWHGTSWKCRLAISYGQNFYLLSTAVFQYKMCIFQMLTIHFLSEKFSLYAQNFHCLQTWGQIFQLRQRFFYHRTVVMRQIAVDHETDIYIKVYAMNNMCQFSCVHVHVHVYVTCKLCQQKGCRQL